MRRHGISGPLRARPGPPVAFFPCHAIKDTLVVAAVFAALVTFAIGFPAHLDEIANPADSAYVPRPEWYFLSLFELLKYFPGPFEPVATLVIPGLVVGFLFALPFLDRGPSRNPFSRGRVPFTLVMSAIVAATTALTLMGLARLAGELRPQRLGAARHRRACAGHRAPTARARAATWTAGRRRSWRSRASPRTRSGCSRTWPTRWRLPPACAPTPTRRRRRC